MEEALAQAQALTLDLLPALLANVRLLLDMGAALKGQWHERKYFTRKFEKCLIVEKYK